MSTESVRQIIARATAEPEFRSLLFARPDQALSGYELSDVESKALSGMSAETFDQAAAGLEPRVSQAVFNLYGQPTGFPPAEGQPSGFPPVTMEVQPTGF